MKLMNKAEKNASQLLMYPRTVEKGNIKYNIQSVTQLRNAVAKIVWL